MSIAQRKRNRSEGSSYTSGRGGRRPDLNDVYFRSNWEANFARIQVLENREWVYEPECFEISQTGSYLPDFLVNGVYYEIKGWVTEETMKKFELFKKAFPDKNIVFIGPKEYNELKKMYKSRIQCWEGK
jgi:hypothetical protein